MHEFFEGKIRSMPNGCIEWAMSRSKRGYGFARHGGRTFSAHRLSYLLNVGEIGPGLLVCHHCDNPSCVNPDHLFVGTHKDNMQDKVRKGRSNSPNSRKTHCPEGHDYTLHKTKDGKSRRKCTTCSRLRYREIAERARLWREKNNIKPLFINRRRREP